MGAAKSSKAAHSCMVSTCELPAFDRVVNPRTVAVHHKQPPSIQTRPDQGFCAMAADLKLDDLGDWGVEADKAPAPRPAAVEPAPGELASMSCRLQVRPTPLAAHPVKRIPGLFWLQNQRRRRPPLPPRRRSVALRGPTSASASQCAMRTSPARRLLRLCAATCLTRCQEMTVSRACAARVSGRSLVVRLVRVFVPTLSPAGAGTTA